MSDGRTFYYSDYNFQGRKIYAENQHWSCCSGTLPQVAADYRINTYFRDPQGVWVNLYLPSTLHWTHSGTPIVLTQDSDYPFDGGVRFEVKTPKRTEFTLNLRIPAWAASGVISVNGRRQKTSVRPGSFAAIRRNWRNGDRIELDLSPTLRIERFNPQHPQTVALLFGPLVLFAITDQALSLTRADLLAARRTDQRSWQVETPQALVKFLPFTDIGEEQYSTYLRIE
jgi:DUF1680 family protein